MRRLLPLMIMLLVTIGMKAENPVIELQETSPAAGENYSVNDAGGNVVFTFNRQVTVENAWIVPASGDPVAITDRWGTQILKFYYYCGISSQMRELMLSGTIKAGETFRIELDGIKDKENPDVIYGTDGKFSLSLTASRLPAKLVSISKETGDSIKTYYEPGNPNGTISFTFSEPVTCQSARISYGNVENGTFGSKDIPFTINNEIVNANLQGIDMSPAGLKGSTSLSLELKGLKAASDESVVEGNIPGSPGSVAATYKVRNNASESIYGMFKGDIDKDENLQCWISGKATFDAVRFTFMLHGTQAVIEIPAGQITVTDDAENEGAVICSIPLQDLTIDAGKVTVEMVNATDPEGMVFEIKNEFTTTGRTAARTICMGVTPTTGIIETFPRQFVFTFNDAVTVESGTLSNGGQTMRLIVGANIQTSNNKVTVTNFRGAFIGDIVLQLQVKDSKEEYITFGATENYVTAEYTIPSNTFVCTEADPAPGKVASLKTITLTFDTPVEQDNVGGFDPDKKAVVKDESGAEVATGIFSMFDDWDHPMSIIVTLDREITATGVYTLTIPEAAVYNGQFDDFEEDFGVSRGALYNPEKTFTYAIGDIEPTTCAVTPAPGEYETLPTLYTFTFSRNVTVEMAKMINDHTDRMGTDISSAVSTDGKIVTVTLPEGSTADYTLLRLMLKAVDVTGAAVTLGDSEGFVVAEYTTPVASDTYGCTNITPAVDQGVTTLKEFVLTFANPASAEATVGGFDASKEIVLKNEQGQTAATGTIDFADEWTDARITLSEEIGTPGTYTLVVPEGTVYNELFDDSAEDFGVSMGAIYNPELTFTYQLVVDGIGQVTIGQTTGEVSVYDAQGILIRKADISVALENLPRGIYIVNGKKTVIK